MLFYYEVTTDSPYPTTSNGHLEANQFHIAAKMAVQKHRDFLREKGKLRKQGKSITIKIERVKET